MQFKRTDNKTDKLDSFIDGADEQKQKKEHHKGLVPVSVKFAKENKIEISKRYPTYTLTKFIEQSLLNPIEYIKDEILVTIYDRAVWHNTTISDFVRFKMGLIEVPTPIDIRQNKTIKQHLIYTSPEIKEKIQQISKNLRLSVSKYSQIKISATLELKNAFSFEEIIRFKQEAMNYELELEDYIKERLMR